MVLFQWITIREAVLEMSAYQHRELIREMPPFPAQEPNRSKIEIIRSILLPVALCKPHKVYESPVPRFVVLSNLKNLS